MEIKEGYLELQRTLKNAVVASEVSGIPAEDRAHVLQTALSIYPEVKKWVSEFPIILPQRIAATCLVTTAMMPYAQVSTIVDETILGLILFAEDDIVDCAIANTLTDEQIDATLTLFARIAKSGGNTTYRDYPDLICLFPTINDEQPWVQVANSWTKFCQKLQKYPSAVLYYEFFAKHVELAMEAQRIEILHWWPTYKKTGACQTYDQYLENARLTILLSINLSSLLVMLGEPVNSEYSLPAPYTNLEELLDELILTASSGVRLAQDLRSFERERTLQQPGSNSLLTLMKTCGLSEKEAEAFVIKEIDTYLQKIEAPISLLPSSLSVWGDAVRRVCWAAYHFYLTTEFHHFTKEMLAALH